MSNHENQVEREEFQEVLKGGSMNNFYKEQRKTLGERKGISIMS